MYYVESFSGGAFMYPNEYVYLLKIDDYPDGFYHLWRRASPN